MKIGLITYHSAYNFGSVLQAFATQTALQSLGHDVEIINYRMKSQKNYYSLFPTGLGLKTYLKYFLALSLLKKRQSRQQKYEDFFNCNLRLTEEFENPDDAVLYKDKYDVYISGSDQVWNKGSNELHNLENWRKYMSPYLLEFTEKKRISYASSIATMSDADLMKIKDALLRFDSIAMREATSAKRIEALIGKKIRRVLDPTLLLTRDIWMELTSNWENKYGKENYILYYSLKGVRELNRDLTYLSELANKKKLKLITIAPLSVLLKQKNLVNVADAGVLDFIGLIANAKYVVTDSYHGTLFALNFNKQFYSLQRFPGSNMRVEEVASLLGFSNRVIYDYQSIDFEHKFDFDIVNQNRKYYIDESIDYLKNSILG